MSTEVKVPAVGESITSGIVSVWHKKSGDQVKAGDALFTLETDKVSTEITAEKDGVLQTRVAEGAEVKIGEVVAVIEEGSAASKKPAAEPGGPKGEARPTPAAEKKSSDALSPAVRRIVTEAKLDPEKISGSGKGGRLTKGDALAAAENSKAAPEPASAPGADQRAEEKPAAPSENERFTRKKMSPPGARLAGHLFMRPTPARTLR